MAIYRQKRIARHSAELLQQLSEELFIMGFQYIHIEMVSYDLLLFLLKIETITRGANFMPFLIFQQDRLRSTLGIICMSPNWGSFPVWGSFANVSCYDSWEQESLLRSLLPLTPAWNNFCDEGNIWFNSGTLTKNRNS